ncbi:MAG: EAL domain-containing protein, partial [Gammaproteobacteria bacterium]|nr:EAL domain-containing protein [Gammaproteobacteria bacterium]
LLRWNHPELGQLSPDAFLGIADQSGLLPRLGEWVCYNACLQARAIHAMQGGPLQLNINVSARQYHHPHLAELLERIMRETRIPPHLIALEIDESILSEDLKESRDILNRLKALGIQLVVDRFGSGLLSVRQLQQLPFDVAKIDRELIDAIPNDPKTTALVQTLMLIAKQLNLQVIAGGVEQASQCSWLQEHGCRAVQGYYCAPPVASNELAQLFHTLRHERPWQAAASTRPQVPADR